MKPLTMRFWHLGLVLATLLLSSSSLRAQYEVGILLGGSTYYGELSPSSYADQLSLVGFSYGLMLRRDFGSHIGIRLQYQDLDIFGDDGNKESSRQRNLRFYSDVDELSIQAEVYPFRHEFRIAPYLMLGAAVYRFNPLSTFNDQVYELQPLGTEGQGLPGFDEPYSLIRFALPMGGGLRLRVNDRWTVYGEASGRLLFFDYLDDISGRYVDESLLAANGPLAVELAYRTDELGDEFPSSPTAGDLRGSPDTEDYYMSVMIGVTYAFDAGNYRRKGRFSRKRGLPCPTF